MEGYIVKRLINSDVLDVYDKEGKPVCRSCGRPMFNKDGKRNLHKRNCNRKDCGGLARSFWLYYQMANVIPEIVYKDSNEEVKCGECGKVMSIRSHTYEVHHKKPVYKTTVDNWEDVWDPENLIILCLDCHNKTKIYKVIEVVKTVKHQTLDSFLS